METVTISRKEYDQLRRKAAHIDEFAHLDADFVRQVISSKEDLKHGRFKRLA